MFGGKLHRKSNSRKKVVQIGVSSSLTLLLQFHDHGASALLFAPQHNQLVTSGKKGHVAIWDIRQHRQLHSFKAHDHPIKCLAIDPNEEFFVTGSVDGDIKVS